MPESRPDRARESAAGIALARPPRTDPLATAGLRPTSPSAPVFAGAGPLFAGAGPLFAGAGPLFAGAGPLFAGAGPLFAGAGPLFAGAGLCGAENRAE